MNTLPRAITAQFFSEAESYKTLKAGWKALHNSEQRHDLTAAHYLVYLTLRGKDWRKAFTPITSERKLENGAFGGWGLFKALRTLHTQSCEEALLAPFAELVTPVMLQQVRELLPVFNYYTYQPREFTSRKFPFEAYRELPTTRTFNE